MPDDRPAPDVVTRFAQVLRRGGPSPPSPPPPPSPPAAPPSRQVDVDPERLKRLGLIQPGAPEKSTLSEEFRLVKRPLLNKAFQAGAERGANLVLVTSPRKGEGKTFTALNLAFSVASERDLGVLLIDADLYAQSVFGALGLAQGVGFYDLLADESLGWADVTIPTSIANLALVPAGAPTAQATELISSQRTRRLMDEAAAMRPNRLVIIDSPPVLASTEASALAPHVGQVALVVEHNGTGWRSVERALSLLGGCTTIGFVLNKVEPFAWDDSAPYRSRT